MDSETFQRELQKYKVVRLEDYYKPRNKRLESKPLSILPVTERKVNDRIDVAITNSMTFWELLDATLKQNGLLTDEEIKVFVENMKAEKTDISELINLEDLNTAASNLVM